MKSIGFFLFVALLVLIIFVEGIMIIDQEVRINAMRTKVEEVTAQIEKTLNRAEQFISMQEEKEMGTCEATSTEYDIKLK